ncbi:MAG: hypothetical protein R3321_14115 [Nitrososphaeraceae archaeon]|nr:hypothetical protein [Nitrososphaeraceae archaeon]
MKTLENLYSFLQSRSGGSITPWLNKPWKNQNKKGLTVKLFSGLNLIRRFEDYDTSVIFKNRCNIKYDSNLIGISKENNRNILLLYKFTI